MRYLQWVLVLGLLLPQPAPASNSDIVKTWARTLGDELWRLSEALTKSDQIKIKYKHMNASVKKKDGSKILESSLLSVSAMLTRKINAVKCIHATAKKLAQKFNYTMTQDEEFDNTFTYCSAKYSNFDYEPDVDPPPTSKPPSFAENNPHYLNISLEKDSHFYNISVNTNTSCVHVPTNIYYKEKDALNAILWSEGLNDVFIQNYQSDPSLAWQYFGSSHGVLRFYPAMPWNRRKVDTYDCRVKSWYIEAATCSKDVIILFDVSGSMTGFKNYVARRTLQSLLSTLSNNDYVNVYTFNNFTNLVVKCFEDLVQATPENINTLNDALKPFKDGSARVLLEGNANLTKAYTKAFTALKQKRMTKNCTVSSPQGCNQLVMLITDYVPGNLTEVFEEHNREVVNNKTYIPVRVFTYLIGKEVTNVQEIQWMACLNRGYFVHIHSVEEVQQQVLKYINVIARPMILQGDEPPPTWTHANMDETRTKEWEVSGDLKKPEEDKLVTSVAIPAFYEPDSETNDAILLGVAGTDVPIDNIAKLAQPHQLGVNGYSFIVSNNGYLLLHPLLTTTINSELQDNYNSVDFVEVEQVDDGKDSRQLGDEIKSLRQQLVNGDEGSMAEVKVLFHYDRMRRINRVAHDYFFNKLEGTPFSMGISLPRGYGDTELLLKDNPLEAKQGKELTGINVTDYFRFNYRVHPDWVYCKFHYLEGHESAHAEEEIWTFLVKLSQNELNITQKQYTEDTVQRNFSVETHCGDAIKQLGKAKDSYYCNEDLVKQLVFDAKLSTPYFMNWTATPEEWALAAKYNVSVRFIATSSGLTRWDYIFDREKNEMVNNEGVRIKGTNDKEVFGDKYHNTIEETWYKAAVLQHMIMKEAVVVEESMVVATNLPDLDEVITEKEPVENADGDITITSSYAIFYKDGEFETPASVVGFQYSHSKFHERFSEITKLGQGKEKELICGNHYDCFVIDSSGYVVLSISTSQVGNSNNSQVGQFFGAINKENGLVLEYLRDKTVFEDVTVFNYQALCPKSALKKAVDSAWSLQSPFSLAGHFIRWLITEILLLVVHWNQYTYAEDFDYDTDTINQGHTESTTTAAPPPVENDTIVAAEEEDVKPFSCDHRIHLYILNQTYFTDDTGLTRTVHADNPGECHPAFWAAYVKKTNLLLVVVKRQEYHFAENCTLPPDTKPTPTTNSTELREPCHKLDLGRLERRQLEGCYTYHDGERNITECGMGSIARANPLLFVVTASLVTLVSGLLT